MSDMAEQHSGGMIALLPADPGALAIDGGDPVDELHLTLAFLCEDVSTLSGEHREALDRIVREIADPPRPRGDDRGVPTYPTPRGPVHGEIWGHAVYNPGPDGAVVYLVKDPELAEGEVPSPTRQWLENLHYAAAGRARDALGVLMAPQRRSFEPHVTAGWTREGVDLSSLRATGPVVFDRIRLALGGTVVDYPLVDEVKYQSADPRARRLARWWARDPKGRARWNPGTPGDYNRLRRALRKEIGPSMPQRVLDGLAANIHKMATGEWPGPKAHGGRGKKDMNVAGEVKTVKKMDDDELMSTLDKYADMESDLSVRPVESEEDSEGETDDVPTEELFEEATENGAEWDLRPDGTLERVGDEEGEDDEDDVVEDLTVELAALFDDATYAGQEA